MRDPLAFADDLLRAAGTASDPAPGIPGARALGGEPQARDAGDLPEGNRIAATSSFRAAR